MTSKNYQIFMDSAVVFNMETPAPTAETIEQRKALLASKEFKRCKRASTVYGTATALTCILTLALVFTAIQGLALGMIIPGELFLCAAAFGIAAFFMLVGRSNTLFNIVDSCEKELNNLSSIQELDCAELFALSQASEAGMDYRQQVLALNREFTVGELKMMREWKAKVALKMARAQLYNQELTA
ncbi:hemolysin D [Novimethylophilus kurashikiensis]|uniref:Hemolysin D n=1 Tax=Novimethylophilus kurashikiensis TaxID=1825523 RepID=A0A2R5F9S2_9PROT|nr:hypothetical protein [Novimethylophilus kurashikiensis]GBG14569.1 hemolysin D [Novimethylophilus kurashikiensis]